MQHRWKTRAATLLLVLCVLFTGAASSAAVAASPQSSTDDLLTVKLFDKCRGLLPSKKIECIKTETKKVIGDSVDECLKKPLGEGLPCLREKVKSETGRIAGLLYFLYYWYQAEGGQNNESIVGDIGRIEQIRTDPLILLKDKDLLPELRNRLAVEMGKIKGVDLNGKCGKDASLLAQLSCLKDRAIPNMSARQTLLLLGYLQIFLMKQADNQKMGEVIFELRTSLSKAKAEPSLLKDEKFQEKLKRQIAEIKTRGVANLDSWAIQSKEALRSMSDIISDLKDLKWPEFGSFLPADWDKTFGPNGSMDKFIKETKKWDHELGRMNRDLDQMNASLDQMAIDLNQMNASIDAGMRDIDRDMAQLRKNVEAMYAIDNRKHPEAWENVFKDLDLKSVGEYVRDGHMSPEENKIFQNIVSGILDFTPGFGDAKGIMEAISGKDTVSGRKLAGSERIVGSIILFRWLKAGKKIITAEELAKATKAEKATGKIDGWLSRAAYDKVPGSLKKYESVTNKGVGYHWNSPKGDGIRIDKGNLNNSQIYQQVDHVVVNSGGKVIGRDGKPISGSIKQNAYEAHIPLTDWLKWKEWNRP